MAGLPYGALPQDTAEFMLGKVAVTPVFLESTGGLDASTENWTPQLIQSTLQTVQAGVNWWADTLDVQQSVHSLDFVFDTTYATNPAPTRYEPINRVSNEYAQWVPEFLAGAGFNTGNIETDMRAFNNSQRLKMGADWAYTIFVINSNNDADGQFPAGGSFLRAFSFAGGLFVVSPSTRPESTYAHETGHIFWAKDEYAGGASYAERRGYYNTQNTNAADNPSVGFVQQPSIMATGALLDQAYREHLSPASTLAMIGWQDSDRDGIFDVLDVPLELTGTGYYDPQSAAYKFHGSAKVGTLWNLNSEGLRNDITLNRVSSIEYRVDNGAWTTLSHPDVYETELNLSIPLPQSGQSIDIRAVDAKTGIASNVFHGRLTRADAVQVPGINGSVWIDTNKNHLSDLGEVGDASWSVDVLSSAGQPLNLRREVEPDNLPDGLLSAGSVAGAIITATGADADGRAGVFGEPVTSTGSKAFRAYSRAAQSWLSTWNASRRMQVDFASPTSVVEIDGIAAASDSFGRLEAYDTSGNLIDRFTTGRLTNGQIGKMRVESSSGNIARVVVGGHAKSSVRLDNLRFGPETTSRTLGQGQFSLFGLPAGNYLVKVTPTSNGFGPQSTGGNMRPAVVTTGGVTSGIDFVFESNASQFTNPSNRHDVNDDESVTALDVLLIVNDINQHGARDLAVAGYQASPYLDVNGDGFSSALDALLVINYINLAGAGEGDAIAIVTGGVQAFPAAEAGIEVDGPAAIASGEALACQPLQTPSIAATRSPSPSVATPLGLARAAAWPGARDEALLSIAAEFLAVPDSGLDAWRERRRR